MELVLSILVLLLHLRSMEATDWSSAQGRLVQFTDKNTFVHRSKDKAFIIYEERDMKTFRRMATRQNQVDRRWSQATISPSSDRLPGIQLAITNHEEGKVRRKQEMSDSSTAKEGHQKVGPSNHAWLREQYWLKHSFQPFSSSFIA